MSASKQRPPPSRRRSPRQDRSQATVEVIVQATEQVLVDSGWEGFSTNKVAQVAGVSIGSLYQYFPDKESLVLAVFERVQAQMFEAMSQRLARLSSASPEAAVTEMVRAAFQLNRQRPKLQRVFLEQVPRIGKLSRVHELNSAYAPLIEVWLTAHRDTVRVDRPAVAAWVLVAAMEGVVTRAVLVKPLAFDEDELVANLVRLVIGYLSVRG